MSRGGLWAAVLSAVIVSAGASAHGPDSASVVKAFSIRRPVLLVPGLILQFPTLPALAPEKDLNRRNIFEPNPNVPPPAGGPGQPSSESTSGVCDLV